MTRGSYYIIEVSENGSDNGMAQYNWLQIDTVILQILERASIRSPPFFTVTALGHSFFLQSFAAPFAEVETAITKYIIDLIKWLLQLQGARWVTSMTCSYSYVYCR